MPSCTYHQLGDSIVPDGATTSNNAQTPGRCELLARKTSGAPLPTVTSSAGMSRFASPAGRAPTIILYTVNRLGVAIRTIALPRAPTHLRRVRAWGLLVPFAAHVTEMGAASNHNHDVNRQTS